MIAETTLMFPGVNDALRYIGAPTWLEGHHESDAETLVEFMGRLCYKSFEVGLNPNVTKIREGNQPYLANVLKQKHGSVFEHAYTTFVLCNISRILTHELVRHRAGTAYSQESQRFVRLDDFQLYIPDLTESLIELCPHDPSFVIRGAVGEGDSVVPISREEWVQSRQDAFIQMSERIKEFTKDEVATYLQSIGLDAEGVNFHVKKTLTSALRRLLPGGVNTNIGITANHRTWRHLIQNRTAAGAEVEIREVFMDIAQQLQERYPNIYQDINWNDDGSTTFLNEKI
jgi:thymidylate synthase (FAD)